MDNVNPINRPQGIPSGMEQNPNQIRNQEQAGIKPPPPPFNVDLTPIGKLFSAAGESNESTRAELKQTIDSFLKEVQKRDFDLDDFLQNVSDEIKDLADQAGINLHSAFSELAEKAEHSNGQVPQGPPPGGRRPQGPPPPPPNDRINGSAFDQQENS